MCESNDAYIREQEADRGAAKREKKKLLKKEEEKKGCQRRKKQRQSQKRREEGEREAKGGSRSGSPASEASASPITVQDPLIKIDHSLEDIWKLHMDLFLKMNMA